VSWNLLSTVGNPIAGGLYEARIQGRDPSGRALPPQVLRFAVVRLGDTS
jgi:hypothetical protein